MMNKMEKHDFRESHGASRQRGQLRLFSKSEEKEQQREKATAFAEENCAHCDLRRCCAEFWVHTQGTVPSAWNGQQKCNDFSGGA